MPLRLFRLPIGLGLAGVLPRLGVVEPRRVCSFGRGANHEGRLSMVTWLGLGVTWLGLGVTWLGRGPALDGHLVSK